MSIDLPKPAGGGFLGRHDEEGFIEALGLLIESGRVSTAEALIHYAESAGEPHAAEFLRGLAEEGLPLKLVYDAFSVHARIVAFKRNTGLLKECQGKKIGLVMPLPPHVMEGFLGLPNLVVITPDGQQLPPPLRRRQLSEVKGSRAGRKIISDMQIIVFEAFRKDSEFFLDQSVADVIDPRVIPPTTLMIVHLRPHSNPDDQPLGASHTISIL